MAFISITRLRVRSARFMPSFLVQTQRTLVQLRKSTGFVDGALLADRSFTFWTMTSWQDRENMRQYITPSAHGAVMPLLMDWCDEASIVHWDQPTNQLPDWSQADRRMRNEGRPSKVRNPSPNHRDLSFRKPRKLIAIGVRPKIDAVERPADA